MGTKVFNRIKGYQSKNTKKCSQCHSDIDEDDEKRGYCPNCYFLLLDAPKIKKK
jgi:predicted amidophosphoribosyltransferase